MPNPSTQFKPGEDDRRGKGGAREGAGRKPDWFKAECRRILDDSKALEFYGRVIRQENVRPFVTMMGEKGYGPPMPLEVMEAIKTLKEWGYGKTPLPMRMVDEDDKPVGVIVLPAQTMGRSGAVISPRAMKKEGIESGGEVSRHGRKRSSS